MGYTRSLSDFNTLLYNYFLKKQVSALKDKGINSGSEKMKKGI
jgi:hypothetical protein